MSSDNKKVILFGEKSKRTSTNKWAFDITQLSLDEQLAYIKKIKNGDEIENPAISSVIIRELDAKIGGYRSQDTKKGLYNKEEFVDRETVLNLMSECENLCYYCHQKVHVLYETARESRQWTLERIDNDFGHNKKNVAIACLKCNVTRKTMYHERFAFTKQLCIEKKT